MVDQLDDGSAPKMLTPEELKQRNRRNLSIALALGAFVIIVFLVTILRLGASVADRPF